MKDIDLKNLKVRIYGDPILRQQSKPVEEITPEIRRLVEAMIEYIDSHNGIGLAAVQVGILLRFFVRRDYITLPDGKWTVSEPKVFINPKILSVSKEMCDDDEGCLSIPTLRTGPVSRPFKVKVEATNLEGKQFVEELEGENARVIFHENDHLNGVLFIDRLPQKERKKIEPLLKKIQSRIVSSP